MDTAEGKLWAETRGFSYFETSALTGENVDLMFETLVKRVSEASVGGNRPAERHFELPYTPEQATLVTKIRNCKDDHQMLGLTRGCSR